MLTIGFSGDFCTMYRMEEVVKKQIWEESFSEVLPFFSQNDFNVLDLEAPLTTHTEGITKSGPVIKMLPQSASILNYLNCNLVATANNHLMDYGVNGLLETYKTLRDFGIEQVGSGLNEKDAAKFKIIRKNNVSVAIINATENEWSTTHGEHAGCNAMEPIRLFHQIQLAKSEADYVVIIAHGGHEHYPLPTLRIKELYRFLIDAGADAVVSHHPHIVSGFETHKDKPIFYSLGNFCFDWPNKRNSEWNYGLLLRLTFSKDNSIKFEYVHINQNDDKVGIYLVSDKKLDKRETRLQQLNETIQSDQALSKAFHDYANSKHKVMRTLLEPYAGRLLPSLHVRGLLPSFVSKRKLTWLTNIIRAESHRELLLESLKK